MVQVYRKKWVIHIERITREKVNGERGRAKQSSISCVLHVWGCGRMVGMAGSRRAAGPAEQRERAAAAWRSPAAAHSAQPMRQRRAADGNAVVARRCICSAVGADRLDCSGARSRQHSSVSPSQQEEAATSSRPGAAQLQAPRAGQGQARDWGGTRED